MLFIVNAFETIDNFLCVFPLRCTKLQRFTLILSNMVLLILQSSFFAGFKNLTVGLFLKLGLWSFNVIKQFCLSLTNILFITSLFFTMFFPWLLIWSLWRFFYYVTTTLSMPLQQHFFNTVKITLFFGTFKLCIKVT